MSGPYGWFVAALLTTTSIRPNARRASSVTSRR